MIRFTLRRLLLAIPTVLGVALLSFVMLKVAGGDPALLLAGDERDPEAIAAIRRELGLDQPNYVQFGRFVTDAAQGDFGVSYVTGRPVADVVARRYPRTLALAGLSMLFALGGGVAMGVLSAVRVNSWVDRSITTFSVIGMSVPGFWLALLLIYLFSVQLDLLPSFGLRGPEDLILPAIVTSAFSLAFIARLTRSEMLDVLDQDFIQTARAKGVLQRVVTRRHGLKNALIPIVTVAGTSFGLMLGGTVVTETVFAIEGIGVMIVDGVLARDIPVVQTGVMVLALNFILVTFLLDILYALLDPRIRTLART